MITIKPFILVRLEARNGLLDVLNIKDKKMDTWEFHHLNTLDES